MTGTYFLSEVPLNGIVATVEPNTVVSCLQNRGGINVVTVGFHRDFNFLKVKIR